MPTKIRPILLIILLALVLRGYQIWTYPPLNPDEAALGYNAYSLILTGKDEHGIPWPLHFKSFGDYKPGLYVYLVIPFVKILGLMPIAIRLPNLLLSILSIYTLYKTVLLLTKNSQLSSLTALILTLNPWHLHFSRGAWESSTALSFILIGTYFFFKHLQNFKYLYFSILFFVLSLYTYHSARLISPLLFLSLIFIHRIYFINRKSKIFLPLLFGLTLTLPVLLSFLQNGGTTRFGGVGLTADHGPLSRSEELLNQHSNFTLSTRLIHNRRILYLLSWAQKYTSHFDPNFLFLNGDDVPRSKIPDMGQLYFVDLPFLLFGVYSLFHFQKVKNLLPITCCLLLISPLASSLTFQSPSALRSLPLIVPLTIIVSIGLYFFLQKFHSFTVYSLLFIIYLFSIVYYLDSYYIHYQKRYSESWNYGFQQLIPYVESQKNNFSDIWITNKYDQPYIFYLFFSQYPPQQLQPQIQLTPKDQYGFSTVTKIDNIHFGRIDWNQIGPNSLIITANEPVPQEPLKTLNFPNGQSAFKIYIK